MRTSGRTQRHVVGPAFPKEAMKRWVGLRGRQGQALNWFVTHVDDSYLGGYISRGSVQLPLEARTETAEAAAGGGGLGLPGGESAQALLAAAGGLKRWRTARLADGTVIELYPVYINVNFIGGYVRLAELDSVDVGLLPDQRFFEEYDLRFHPGLLPSNPYIAAAEKRKRIQIVERTEPALYRIMQNRAAAAKTGASSMRSEPAGKLEPGDLRYLSGRQLELYREFFPDGRGGIDYSRVQRAFERFDNGELQGNAYPGALQPDSASDFLFAEFALQAIRHGIERDLWSELLKSFVKTQEIYIEVYRPEGIRQPELADYTYTNFRYGRQIGEERKEQLRRRYDDLTPAELEQAYMRNLAKAQGAERSNPPDGQGIPAEQ